MTAGDNQLTLQVPFDGEEQEPCATRTSAGVMAIYTIEAFSGTPGKPLAFRACRCP